MNSVYLANNFGSSALIKEKEHAVSSLRLILYCTATPEPDNKAFSSGPWLKSVAINKIAQHQPKFATLVAGNISKLRQQNNPQQSLWPAGQHQPQLRQQKRWLRAIAQSLWPTTSAQIAPTQHSNHGRLGDVSPTWDPHGRQRQPKLRQPNNPQQSLWPAGHCVNKKGGCSNCAILMAGNISPNCINKRGG